ncbi:hypothetical protein PRABACTJOHN_00692 [Parabacteroides johnsonii DSM 18315]|uniref:Uncharacterized protein n=1 Tax=Parabacteroides johnsonii DSM 18315 TaxID=537006 RepID=B7B6P7_9BACT|nr:hypothetical protein PRABACTJOHN_00692 [Parabacteroides johnsonii DSM 18315]
MDKALYDGQIIVHCQLPIVNFFLLLLPNMILLNNGIAKA